MVYGSLCRILWWKTPLVLGDLSGWTVSFSFFFSAAARLLLATCSVKIPPILWADGAASTLALFVHTQLSYEFSQFQPEAVGDLCALCFAAKPVCTKSLCEVLLINAAIKCLYRVLGWHSDKWLGELAKKCICYTKTGSCISKPTDFLHYLLYSGDCKVQADGHRPSEHLRGSLFNLCFKGTSLQISADFHLFIAVHEIHFGSIGILVKRHVVLRPPSSTIGRTGTMQPNVSQHHDSDRPISVVWIGRPERKDLIICKLWRRVVSDYTQEQKFWPILPCSRDSQMCLKKRKVTHVYGAQGAHRLKV